MRKYVNSKKSIEQTLSTYSQSVRLLRGLSTQARLDTLVDQIISSIRRIDFVRDLDKRPIDLNRANPQSTLFDPLKAAIIHRNAGDIDEAIWLVFLGTHFGKHSIDGWRLARDIYGAFGTQPSWTWQNITLNRQGFVVWVNQHLQLLLSDGVSRRFSNHRKYESKKSSAILDVLLSYVDTVGAYGNHRNWLVAGHQAVGQNPTEAFDWLYQSMRVVKRFGRLGTFDFLTMIGKLGLFPIEPGKAYLDGATGPLRGVRLLLDNNPNSSTQAQTLELLLADIDNQLQVGKQVLEDSLCNWQKSPDHYIYFRG